MNRVDGYSNYQQAYTTFKQDARMQNGLQKPAKESSASQGPMTPVEEMVEYHAFIPAADEVSLLESVTGLQWENKTDIFMPICVSTFDFSV